MPDSSGDMTGGVLASYHRVVERAARQARDDERAALLPIIALLLDRLGGEATITRTNLETYERERPLLCIENEVDPATGAVRLRVTRRPAREGP